MHTTHVLYLLGGEIHHWMAAEGVDESDAFIWQSFWQSLVSKTAAAGLDDAEKSARQLVGAIRVASASVYGIRKDRGCGQS